MKEVSREELEKAVKQILYYLELDEKEHREKGEKSCDWAWNLKNALRNRLGYDHSGFVGWEHEFVLKCWLIVEIWKDGRIVPRCIAMTPSEAEKAKDLLEYSYESEEPKNRPKISIEHQRLNHIFGFSMLGRKFEGLYEPK